jgi:hypothetical protein
VPSKPGHDETRKRHEPLKLQFDARKRWHSEPSLPMTRMAAADARVRAAYLRKTEPCRCPLSGSMRKVLRWLAICQVVSPQNARSTSALFCDEMRDECTDGGLRAT